MTRRCDRCGKTVADAVGSRQATLFDLDASPLATDAARAELRAGRILCPACQRAGELFAETPDPGALASVDAALDADAVADLDDGPGGWQGRHVYQGDPETPEDRARRTGR